MKTADPLGGELEHAFTREELARMLSSALGLAKATEIVESASEALQLGDRLTHDEAHELLTALSQASDLVGLTATLAKSRLHFLRSVHNVGK